MKPNELSFKDLMVGDWVYGIFSGYPQEKITMKYSICSNSYEWKYMPIPLTPEILEKNGFTRDTLWHHCDKDFGNYTISVQLGYANKIEYIRIAEKGKDDVVPSERTKLYLTHIKYVHELQRALRLCGIEKEIEL